MPQKVHVIKPSGTRFERLFADSDTPEMILAALDSIKDQFGYNGTVRKDDPNSPVPVMVEFGDPSTGFAFDNPKTVVVILKTSPNGRVVEDDKGNPIVIKQIKGPTTTPNPQE